MGFSSATPTTIRFNGQAANSDAAVYTSSGTTTLKKIIAWNATGASHTITLKIVRSAVSNTENLTTDGKGNLAALTLAAGTATDIFDAVKMELNEIVLLNGDSLHAVADAATAVNILAF